MNKKTKFLITGLSTMAVAIPFIITTSCSTSTGIKFINISQKTSVVGDITSEELAANPIAMTTLEKVFDGITKDNFNQFTSSWDSKTNKITLTVKDGYKFGNEEAPQNSIDSIVITPIIILNITPNINVSTNGITLTEINAQPITRETLIKAFEGIDDTNINNFFSKVSSVPSQNLYTITLVAKDGFAFGKDLKKELPSLSFTI
ncbi:MAG: hypothetical protein ACRCRP_02385 [Metamycoplasmataceae bacterium]